MNPIHRRHFLCLLLAGTGIVSLHAQVTQPLAPGSRIGVEHCQRVEMQVASSGRLDIIATPAAETTVMGYTDKPVPADTKVPANMQYWLQCVEQGAAFVEQHPEIQLGGKHAPATVVRPLLGDIEWDQSAPYNALCPSGTPVGCVATAMAQVMLYWKHPAQGYGSHSWQWSGTTHYVDFGATTYDWDLMLPKYGRLAHATPEQEAEAAKLSYHCGVSIDMMYGPDGSGSFSEHVPYALKNYFDYNDRMAVVYRTSYSYDGWNELLNSELEAGRPILFSASSDEAGHAFVIDGVDANGLYHVNWGWDGWYNGYFDICILNPFGAGIGATETEIGFCLGQTAIIQVCPEKGVGRPYSPIISGGVYPNYNETAFVLSTYMENATYDTIQGVCGIEVLDNLGQHVRYEMGDTITVYPYGTWDRRHNHYYYAWTNTYAYGNGLADGNYTARLCFEHFAADTVIYEVPTHYYMTPTLAYEINDGKIIDVNDCSGTNHLEGRNFNLQGQELAIGREYVATIDVDNRGNDPFSGIITLVFLTPDGNQSSIPECESPDPHIFIPAGGTCTVKFPFHITQEGEWRARLVAYNIPMDYYITECPMDTEIAFSAQFTDESPAALLLLEAPQLLTERCEVDGEIEFQLILSNKGGKFCDRLGMQFYTGKTATGSPSFNISEEVEVQMTTEIDTIIVKGLLTEAKGMKKYYALPFYHDVYGENQLLKIISPDGEETAPEPIEIRVYNASGIETITIDEATVAPHYDLFGRPVPAGTSPHRITISKGQKTLKH